MSACAVKAKMSDDEFMVDDDEEYDLVIKESFAIL